MDTPTSEPTVEFTKAGEGYDPKQVDEVVTSMRAELASLRSQVRKPSPTSSGRTSDRENGDRLHDPDRAVERMLAAAQQTADRVVYEAEAEAERVLAEADDEVLDRINKAEANSQERISNSEVQGERIRKEAVTEARRVVEETRGPLAREVKKLRDTRDALRLEIDTLRGLLSTHRESVRNASDSLRTLADDPEVFRVADPGPRIEVGVNLDEDFEIPVSAAEIDLRESAESETETISTGTSETGTDNLSAKPKSGDDKRSGATASAVKASAEKTTQSSAPKAATAAAPVAVGAEAQGKGAPRIVTLDDIKDDAEEVTQDDADDNEVSGRVITGAFADQLEDESEDDLFRIGENAMDTDEASSASDKAGFLNTVREAAVAEDEGGLGEVDEEQGRAISNFFESAIEEPKSRFGRRKS